MFSYARLFVDKGALKSIQSDRPTFQNLKPVRSKMFSAPSFKKSETRKVKVSVGEVT